ncbi:MAG: hypothetical protein IAE96_11675 [Chitinophagaceae bacterium]|nr:hypothetical protein [Chitinophagaceae bacterium]
MRKDQVYFIINCAAFFLIATSNSIQIRLFFWGVVTMRGLDMIVDAAIELSKKENSVVKKPNLLLLGVGFLVIVLGTLTYYFRSIVK